MPREKGVDLLTVTYVTTRNPAKQTILLQKNANLFLTQNCLRVSRLGLHAKKSKIKKGSEREATNIDPVFKVYHDCDDGIKPGHRKVKFRIPSSYITNGKIPKRIFDIGVLNLETIFAKEEREFL
ncbi:unnamed protein product [Strongylus vulgaris]|uniref:Transthyretin-like family protein n=1 Tax=Strongylus vulgaris TaxID=40348 RepID=A0A3P7JJD5_STRVU|nr:unnamed protein product [Strongylus vulgaris]